MDIIEIEIDCDECRTTIMKNDKVFCESCLDKKDEQIKELEKKIEVIENDSAGFENEVERLNAEVERLTEEINALTVD